MANILTITHARDRHAVIVQFALHHFGINNRLIYTDGLVERHKSSFHFAEAGSQKMDFDGELENLSDFDTVWLRRIAAPTVPKEQIDPRDLANATLLSQSYLGNVLHGVGNKAKWINSIAGTYRAESKLAQLNAAIEVGMSIPETLISNDPADIRSFVESGPSIHKSLVPLYWSEEGNVYGATTTSISIDDLNDDKIMQFAPYIYQRKIAKTADLRVIVMGEKFTAVRFSSADNPSGVDDIRLVPIGSLKGCIVPIDSFLKTKCIEVMAKLGIVNGSFDFVEGEDGKLYFLEVNSGGQFLWVEQAVPETMLLSKFLSQLVSSERNFDISINNVTRNPEFLAWEKTRKAKATSKTQEVC